MSGRRQDEEESTTGKIYLSGIGVRVNNPAGMSFTVLDAWVESGGKQVAELEIGKAFVVKVKYECSYPELGWIGDFWVVSVTASDGKTVKLYDNTSLSVKSASGIMTLDNPKPAVMPAGNVRLVVQPWGSDIAGDYWTTPPEPWI